MVAIDIDKLEAGPELDALVAEKVMGWQLKKVRRSFGTSTMGFEYADRDAWVDGNGTAVCEPWEWQPGDELDDAWQVVEKFLADDYRFALDNREGLPWWAEFALPDYSEGDQDIAETPTLAICRAALKAVMATQLAIQPSQTP